MSTDIRPADLALKHPAQTVVPSARMKDRPLQDENGTHYARRGGPTGRGMFLFILALFGACLLLGLFLSLLTQA